MRQVFHEHGTEFRCAFVGMFPPGPQAQPTDAVQYYQLAVSVHTASFLRAGGCSYTYHRAVKGDTLSPCGTLNTDSLNYTSQPANAVYRNNRCLL
jgi:hypothetical protein